MSNKATLRCPKCEWDGAQEGKHDAFFRYVEDLTREQRVEGLNSRGALEISVGDALELEDPGSRRFRCGECRAEFPIPRGLSIEFV